MVDLSLSSLESLFLRFSSYMLEKSVRHIDCMYRPFGIDLNWAHKVSNFTAYRLPSCHHFVWLHVPPKPTNTNRQSVLKGRRQQIGSLKLTVVAQRNLGIAGSLLVITTSANASWYCSRQVVLHHVFPLLVAGLLRHQSWRRWRTVLREVLLQCTTPRKPVRPNYCFWVVTSDIALDWSALLQSSSWKTWPYNIIHLQSLCKTPKNNLYNL